MKVFFFSILVFIFITTTANAQNFHLDLFAGTSNYQGDLQDKRFTFNQAHFAGGLGVSYDLTDHFSLRTGIYFGTVSGDDKLGRNRLRNLNFTSKITEGMLGIQYYITPLADHVLTPYLFAGLAVYHFDPYTNDTSAKKYYLKPLSTEGEGFIPGINNYSLTQVAIPFGGGVKLSLTDNINVGLEVGFRKLFTDYLDDVSGNYVDQSLLLSNRGPKAVELAYREGELKTGSTTYPAAGTQRGSPKSRDWYYFTGLTLSFRLGNGQHSGAMGSRRSEYGCPVNVR
ncbi:MAG: DUF6089 family protein [Bacteroidota bacterium]|nr:DUF6089 family protein [Bacteroidota bacterium]